MGGMFICFGSSRKGKACEISSVTLIVHRFVLEEYALAYSLQTTNRVTEFEQKRLRHHIFLQDSTKGKNFAREDIQYRVWVRVGSSDYMVGIFLRPVFIFIPISTSILRPLLFCGQRCMVV